MTAKDWNDFKGLWREACIQQSTGVGAVFTMQEGEPKPTGDAGTLVVVDVVDYHHRSTGARIMFGVMTGNAYINAKVTFRDLKSGDLRGSKAYDTKSSARSRANPEDRVVTIRRHGGPLCECFDVV